MVKWLSLIGMLCTISLVDSMEAPPITQQPTWDDTLDFQYIEEQLITQPIIELKEMRNYLSEQGKKARYTKKVYLATLANGLKAVFKPESELRFSYGEVAAYKASVWLGQRLVPPTVLKTYQGKEGILQGSLQFFVESPFDLLKRRDNKLAFSLLSEKEKSDMYLFCFIFGQWDNHAGNQIIAYNNEKAKLALIDNAVVITWSKTRYGQHSFIRQIGFEPNFSYTGVFPFEEESFIALPAHIETSSLESSLESESRKRKCLEPNMISLDTLECNNNRFKGKDYAIPVSFVQGWNSLGVSQLPVIMWHDALWIQYYKTNREASLGTLAQRINFTYVYSKSTLERYTQLTYKVLCTIFENALKEGLNSCTQEFLLNILERRDQILSVSNKELIP